jgi:hypothetical protein
MGHWPTGEGRALGTAPASATTAGTAHVKGSWSQAIAAAPFEVGGVMISGRGPDSNYTQLVDIGVGGAAAEQVIIPNAWFYQSVNIFSHTKNSPFFPVRIPKGTRIAVRGQGAQINANVPDTLTLIPVGGLRSHQPYTQAVAIGADTANSRGTGLTIPASGTGTYAQLTASLSRSARMLMALVGNPSGLTDVAFTVDIGIGAAAAEQVIVPGLDITLRATGGGVEQCPIQQFGPWPLLIPAGTRLAARANFVGGTGTQTVYILLYGMN